MSRRSGDEFKPLSLVQHFGSPEDYRGIFGWLCGYSADAAFLDDASERFLRQTRAQRAYEGRIRLALMLDPGNEPITLVDVPAVAHLPMVNPLEKPFALLHAKVALLGFQHEQDPMRWQLRLIVSTGNWTRETLEESLDLVWTVTLLSEDLVAPSAMAKQVGADIKAAWTMFDWLREHFDTRILEASALGQEAGETLRAMRLLASWANVATRIGSGRTPRFFDSRKDSLLGQIPGLVVEFGGAGKRNYLAMGSGFYEGKANKDNVPSVIHEIAQTLKRHELLTATPSADVFVNPRACQAVSASLDALEKNGFTVRPPGQPDYFGKNAPRFLHAKFLFSANHRVNSPYCNSPWIYLGSGNLTGPGFKNRMSPSGGNLEAGVVFAPEELFRYGYKGIYPEQVVTNLLPLQWDKDVTDLPAPPASGAEMPERSIKFIAAPVAWMLWFDEGDNGFLVSPQSCAMSFDVVGADGEMCHADSEGHLLWQGGRPRHVVVRWAINGKTQKATVPVLDKFGRLAAATLPQLAMDEAWWQLENFPMPPSEDDLEQDENDTGRQDTTQKRRRTDSVVANYPIRQMMQLVENIAAKQTHVAQPDWLAWCGRLEQTLIQASCNSVVEEFVLLGINPLSPLWQSPFRPAFAENSDTADGQQYEATLRRVELAWKVESLNRLGEAR